MGVKITGLNELIGDLDEAQAAISSVEGELGTVSFNPADPESIEAAIQGAETMIDSRLGLYAGNPIIGPIIDQMKEHFRKAIIDRAASARLESNAENDN